MKKIALNINEYNASRWFIFPREWDHSISIKKEHWEIVLKCNRDWLVSLAQILIQLAQDDFENNYHIHLDEYWGLEDWSEQFIIQKSLP